MKPYQFRAGSAAAFFESLMDIDQFGCSDWYEIDFLNDSGISSGLKPIKGNGSTIFQNDRGFGKKYVIEKSRDSRGSVEAVRLRGFCPISQQLRGVAIPKEVRQKLSKLSCVHCGTSSNIEIDHKNGRKDFSLENGIDAFQPLCKHCNVLKRERCKKCDEGGKRFDAKTLGFQVGWINGSSQYAGAREGCDGCYMYDPSSFKKVLSINKEESSK